MNVQLLKSGRHFIFIILLCAPMLVRAQSDSTKQVKVAAGPQFKASSVKQFWWGKHWRPEWLQPVSFPVFDIDTVKGGLEPKKMGGGHQTKSLRMISKDGREYVLRTIDKDLELLIPDEFKESVVHDILNDQISTAHPYGPLAIASLAGAIGAMHTNPVIYYVPDDPRFGEFQKTFANKLCLFEERPSGDGWEKTALVNNADKIRNSEKLLEKLQEDNDDQVDQKDFLRIRLLDMVVNDWDRHPDQWVWTAQKKDGKTIYYPFARDRDQAFSKTDGVNIFLLSLPWVLRSVRNLNANIHDVIGVNLAAVTLDKQFMNELTKEDWINIIKEVQASLSDDAIHQAVMTMPPEIYTMSGAFLEKRLKQRRDNMMFYGLKYYHVLNKRVYLVGTDKTELFTIDKKNRNTTEITVQKINKENVVTDTIFNRTFTRNVTREINIYAFDNDDRFIYKGDRKNRLVIRNIGGRGNDIYLDSTTGKGSGYKTHIYDSTDNVINVSKGFKVYKGNDTSYFNYSRKVFKYDWWKPNLLPGINPDDGVVIGFGVTYRRQQWHKVPFGWEQSIGGSYATGTGAFGFYYNGLFKHTFGKWDLALSAVARAPRFVLNYYGAGNNTTLNGNDIDYFRVRSSGITVNPGVTRSWKNETLSAGLLFQTVKIQQTAGKFISQPNVIDTGVFDTKHFAGANVSFTTLAIRNKKNPDLGIGFHAGAAYWMNTTVTTRDFLRFDGYVKAYLPITKSLTFAHRTGAATNTGDYEFYQANTLGGNENLRGYWRTRFTGQTSFYQNTELRLALAKLRGYVFRGTIGVYGFFDDGRVWIKNEKSDKLHTGYGGGIYFIPYNLLAINACVGTSEEKTVFMIRTGFFF